MHSADFGPVLNALSDLLRAFGMTTTDTGNGDRRVDSPAHACTLSEATDRAVKAMGVLWQALPFEPVPAANVPPFISLSSSGSPTTPGKPEAVGEVRALRLGEGGTVPMVVAAYDTLTSVLGFPARRWNAMQARRPGANHPRWLALDVIPRQHIGEIRKAAALLHQVERTLLAREAGESGADLPPRRQIEALARAAAARWASIEAIADLLHERVRAAEGFIAGHPRADHDLTIRADVDLEVDERSADVTGRTLSWSAGSGYARFRGVVMRLYPIARAEVLRYLESRTSSDTSYRPACDGAALMDALRYLNEPSRVEQMWVDIFRQDVRLHDFVAAELLPKAESLMEAGVGPSVSHAQPPIFAGDSLLRSTSEPPIKQQATDGRTRCKVGGGMSIRSVVAKAEAHVRGNGGVVPGRNALAKIVGCAPSSITKAFKHSDYLKARKAERDAKKTGSLRTLNVGASLDVFDGGRGSPRRSDTEPGVLERLIQEQEDDAARDEQAGNRFSRRPEGG